MLATEALWTRRGGLSPEEQRRVVQSLRRSASFDRAELSLPCTVVEALVGGSLCASRNEARRMVTQSAVRIWDQPVSGPEQTISEECVLWSGRKKAALVLRAP
jgi:tyrosyl-tRNA synthetase